MDKRQFLKFSSLGAASLAIPNVSMASSTAKHSVDALPNVNMDVKPIGVEERLRRIAKAQKLMVKHNIDAIVLDAGPAMDYFTGIQWWRSERLVGVVVPKEGDIAVVCPHFEEASLMEVMSFGDDLRLWHEHENPYKLVKAILRDRGITSGRIGFENSVRYFIADGIMSQLPSMTHTSAEPVTRGCRMYKSANELALMHKASEVTLAAYGYVFAKLRVGMTQTELKNLMLDTQRKLGGGSPWSIALFDEAAAYPHGTKKEHTLKEGSIILMDSGCTVMGYRSDISRTLVFGEANKRQKYVWQVARNGQAIAFEKAIAGAPAGQVDDAVRAYYAKEGFGPMYATPGLSHRLGHGIGMEVHETVNFVKGETTPLAKGMCLSNEPGIYIPGEFGVRIEDCIYMGEDRAHWFTEPPESIDKPLGKLAPLIL